MELASVKYEQMKDEPEQTSGEAQVAQNSSDLMERSEKSLCLICVEKPREVRLPCGHSHICEQCAKRLLEQEKPCPTCRASFGSYYKIEKGKIQAQSSFVDPSLKNDWGSLIRPDRIVQTVRTRNKVKQFFTILGLIILVIILLGFFFLFPALGITELVIAVNHQDAQCDKPIVTWLYLAGVFHLVVWVSILCRTVNKRQQNTVTASFINVVSLFLLVMSCAFARRTENCDSTVYGYIWWYSVIHICFLGSLVAFSCLVMILAFCFAFLATLFGRRLPTTRLPTTRQPTQQQPIQESQVEFPQPVEPIQESQEQQQQALPV